MNFKLDQLPHFWIIVIILDLFIVIYNANFIDISGWFPWSASVTEAHGVSLFVLTFIFLIPIIYASIVYGLRGTILAWITFLAGTLPRTIAEVHTLEEWLRFAMFALVTLLMGCLISLSRSAQEQERSLIEQIEPKRWNSVARIVRAQESERKRIARELHNDSLQDLLVIVNHMHSIEMGAYGELPEKTRTQVERVENEVLVVIDSLRRMSHGLNVSVLDNTGLLPALKWLSESVAQETRIKVMVTVIGKEHKLKSEAEVMIFRIVQEALSNIRQHSRASTAEIVLDFSGTEFRLTVKDNGCGFKVREDEQGGGEDSEMGLDIIRQRAKLLGGKLDIRSEPGNGSVIILEVPV
jgi:two-component system sensor histidine kinase DegS